MRDDPQTGWLANLVALLFLTTWPVAGLRFMEIWEPDSGPRLFAAIIIFWGVGTLGSIYLLRTRQFKIWTWLLLILYAIGDAWASPFLLWL
jgi:hypothetical protein